MIPCNYMNMMKASEEYELSGFIGLSGREVEERRPLTWVWREKKE